MKQERAKSTFPRPSAIAAQSLICLVATLAPALANFSLAAASVAHGSPASSKDTSLLTPDAQWRLRDIERKRKEFHVKLLQAKQKEEQANKKLYIIKKNEEIITGRLNTSKNQLRHATIKIQETETSLNLTQSTEAQLSSQAAQRLREIYEGQRMSFFEMLVQVKSLQTLLDLFYYQERIADLDRKLLDQLRAKAVALAAKKNTLGQKQKNLGEMVSQFLQQTFKIQKEKQTQEEITAELRKQRALFEQAENQLAEESHKLESQIADMESASKRENKNMQVGTGNMSMPLRAPITSPFGVRVHPIFHIRKFHSGIDIAGSNHSAIRAADSGTVIYQGWYGGYGKVVIISHGSNKATLYAHLSRTAVGVGDNVKKGEVIAYEGTTGFSTGPHLHFEVRINGKVNNPLNFVR